MAEREQVIKALVAQEKHMEALLALRQVVGVGTGYRWRRGKQTKEICVQVFVNRKSPPEALADHEIIPRELRALGDESVGTDVTEVSTLDAQQDTTRYRPVPGGCSIGPEASVSAGTLGGWACDNTDDTVVLLTNNHVISNLDTMPVLRRVVQPGRLDGGILPDDVIGQLKRDIQLNTVPNVAGANPPASVVDAAIGTIDVDRTDDITQLNIPAAYEIQAPAIGMNVQKRGRTTRLTTNGQITTINATLLVTYRNRTRLGRIQNSFIVTSTNGNPFSGAGDSGSFILNQTAGELAGTFPVVGLLFAGGTDAAGVPITIGNDINAVFGALNLTTVCTCVARAIIDSLFANEIGAGEARLTLVRRKERQLRRLRDQLGRSGPLGEIVEEIIRREAARVGKILSEDDEAFGLAVRAARPILSQSTNLDLLETKLSGEVLDDLAALSTRLSRKSNGLKDQFALTKKFFRGLEGTTIRDVLKSTDVAGEVKKKQPSPSKRKKK